MEKKKKEQAPLPAESSPELFQSLPEGDRFRFSCHKDVSCFTDCCRDLNLMLTPYDVLRVRRTLGMDSTAFLDRYTVTETDPDWKIPVVKLKMEENALRSCPFVSKEGCRIYPDRPAACRAYPLGRAARRSPHGPGVPVVQEKYFLVKEPHCLGFQETQEWAVAEWMQNQGIVPYNEMNDRWMEFLSRYKPGGRTELSPKQWRMFYMAVYSLDRFRDFVFGTRFLSLFVLSEETQKSIRESDEELLKFAFKWLAFSLFGDPQLKMRESSINNAGL